MTRVGEQTFDVPQVRGGGFYPSALEKGTRTERALNLALAEMYVQGVSTRKVITVLQALLGPEVEFRRTEYDLTAAADAIRATSYPDQEEKIELLTSPHSAEEAAEVLEQRALEGLR